MIKKIKFFLIGFLLFSYAFYVQIKVCYSIMGFPDEYFFFFPLLIISLITSITLTIIDFIHKTNYKTIHIVVFLSLLTGLLSGYYVSDIQNKNTKENFNNIIKGIKSYKKENAAYPKTLEDLMPMYLKAIPKSYCGLTKLNYEHEMGKEWPDTIVEFNLWVYDRKTLQKLIFNSKNNNTGYDDRMYH